MSVSHPVPAPVQLAGHSLPTETPECEASTTHAISTPESVELHTAWPGWIPLLIIVVMVASCIGFAVGRIFAW
ncbi:hypothetical protein HUT16_36720 [Kitasatospora sp. NA04385]|uniref:hypothetical protein n=1 Tax=Kitasatospora sp. NA04385 TaxID=2742135 RepID=UPI00158FB606|nr:hypothetical protein [Kitasatospora sp. NA04385]QKW23914.1 hypothetical protein HUT16_36720 [Kitasatospora sp. NA04385]